MRKRRATKREILADPIYNSKVIAKLINIIMIDGKKGTAQTIVYDAFEQIKENCYKEILSGQLFLFYLFVILDKKALNNYKFYLGYSL